MNWSLFGIRCRFCGKRTHRPLRAPGDGTDQPAEFCKKCFARLQRKMEEARRVYAEETERRHAEERTRLAFVEAVESGNIQELRELLKDHPKLVFLKDDIVRWTPLYRTGTPLYWAAERGFKETAEVLLAHGAKINCPGKIPLIAAVSNCHKEVVEFLLAKGANVNAKDDCGHTPLDCAVFRGRKDLVELLFANGASVKDPLDDLDGRKGLRTALHSAAEKGDKDIVRLLLSKTFPDHVDAKGKTPLERAAEKGHTDVVELLLAHHAEHRGAWSIAEENGHNETAALLRRYFPASGLLAHIHPDAYYSIFSAISHAAWRGDNDATMSLLRLNPNAAHLTERTGMTPLHWAAKRGHREVAASLLAHGAEVNVKDSKGGTPLHRAAGESRKDIAELLLANMAEVGARDKRGQTPLHYAAEGGHTEMVELLLANGAKA